MSGSRMLIVEDDAFARRAMVRIFGARGWVMSEAESLAEGLALLDPPPDCVILDLMLPDGDGELLLKKVRDRGLSSRVVVTTACADPHRLAAVAQLGPEGLLCKPVNVNEVCRACNGPPGAGGDVSASQKS